MKINPCVNCPSGDKVQNNKTCMQCDKRIQYVFELDQELHYSLGNNSAISSQPPRSSFTQISRLLTAAAGGL